MIGILGSGFGLYGYLPAIYKYYNNPRVVVLEKSLDVIRSRSDLKKFIPFLDTVSDKEELIKKSDFIIIAYPPIGVESLFENIEWFSNIKKLLIEKPICITSIKSIALIKKLNDLNILVSSGFNFFYTEWYNLLFSSNIEKVNINWRFKPQSNWKNYCENGGGALRMYGIHFLPILLQKNLINFEVGINNDLIFEGKFLTENKEINILIDSNAQSNVFAIDKIFNNETPFGLNNYKNKEDNRVYPLYNLLRSFDRNPKKENDLLIKSLDLLDQIEKSI